MQLVRVLGLLVVALVSLQVAGAQPPAEVLSQIPGLKRSMARDYADKQAVSVSSSGFHYVLEIEGEHREVEGDREYVEQAQVRAELLSVRDAKGLRREDRVNGQLVARTTREGQAHSSTTPFAYEKIDVIEGAAEGKKPISVSKRLQVASFAAPTWKIVNFPTTTTTIIGDQKLTMEQTACFDIRIPDCAATQTAFAAAVREVEEAGHDAKLPLAGNVGPAQFEVPWTGSTGHGEFVIPVEAIVSPNWISVNTPAAGKYLRTRGGEEQETALRVFPGTLRIRWWIGPRPAEED